VRSQRVEQSGATSASLHRDSGSAVLQRAPAPARIGQPCEVTDHAFGTHQTSENDSCVETEMVAPLMSKRLKLARTKLRGAPNFIAHVSGRLLEKSTRSRSKASSSSSLPDEPGRQSPSLGRHRATDDRDVVRGARACFTSRSMGGRWSGCASRADPHKVTVQRVSCAPPVGFGIQSLTAQG